MEKPVAGQFCWNELATADLKKAKDFYGKVFGWNFKEISAGEMGYTIVTSQDKELAGIWSIPNDMKSQIPQHWMAYILVDNVANALDKAKQHGAKIMKDVTEVGDMGRLGIIVDPDGAHVGLWEPNPKK